METRVKREEEWAEDSEFEQEIENSPPPDIGKTGDRERWIENGKKGKEREEGRKGQSNDRKGFFTFCSDVRRECSSPKPLCNGPQPSSSLLKDGMACLDGQERHTFKEGEEA